VAIKEPRQRSGIQDLQTEVMIRVFGLLAAIERDLIAERTQEGLIP
jgi:hypothetical protein